MVANFQNLCYMCNMATYLTFVAISVDLRNVYVIPLLSFNP